MLIAMLIAAAQPAPAPAGDYPVPRETHVFSDWVVACDNTRHCQAVGVQPEGRENFTPNGIMSIERGPEADAPLIINLSQVEGTPAQLAIYDEVMPARLTENEGEYRIEPLDRATFMSRITYSGELTLKDAAGAAIGQISLDGIRGAMLYMDEAQGRLHTTTALVRTGRRPGSDVPAPPPVPTVRIAPATTEAALAIPAARIARLRRDNQCVVGDVGGPDEAETAALGNGRTLILLACGSGAYNVTMVPFVASRQGREIRIEEAPFDIPVDVYEAEEGHRMLVNADWDEQSMSISDFSKGRGFGDCGSHSTYGWDGSRFRLVEREEMPECRGSWIYVTTWRAEVSR